MLTPLLEEYVKYQKSLEKKFKKNCVVLMMVGSFYEMYGFDLPNYKASSFSFRSSADAQDEIENQYGYNANPKNSFGFISFFQLKKHLHLSQMLIRFID